MTAMKPTLIRSAAVSAVLIAVTAVGLLTAGPVMAADLGQDTTQAVDQQTGPEAPPVNPDEPGGGTDGAGSLPEGESAVADGGSKTPYVWMGIGVLLVAAIAAAVWASRKPRAMDLEGGDPGDVTRYEQRYIPPGM